MTLSIQSTKFNSIQNWCCTIFSNHVVPDICLISHMEMETKVEIYLTVDDLFQVMGFACVLDLRFYLIL